MRSVWVQVPLRVHFRFNMEETKNLKLKVEHYKQLLNNTISYREEWTKSLAQMIQQFLSDYSKAVGLELDISHHKDIKNLEVISASLGRSKSGMEEIIEEDTRRAIIKFNGMLLYQQLFNGKINVSIMLPVIEGIQEPPKPIQLGIYRPEEIKGAFILRHLESFIKGISDWEDFDDDNQERVQIGFNHRINAIMKDPPVTGE